MVKTTLGNVDQSLAHHDHVIGMGDRDSGRGEDV